MAGKTWSPEEEAYFWTHIVPFSRRRRGIHLANPELTWQQLGERMQAVFGDESRRTYTALCLEEHFYLNFECGRQSKNAGRYLKAYRALAAEFPGVPEKPPRGTHELNDDVEPTHPATKPGAEMDMELGGEENAAEREAVLELARIAPPNAGSGGKRKREEEPKDEVPLPKRVTRSKGRSGTTVDDEVVGDEVGMAGDTVYVADGDPVDEDGQGGGQLTEDAIAPASPKDKGGGDAAGPASGPREIARTALGATRRVSVRDLLSEDPVVVDDDDDDTEEREVERAARGLLDLTRG